jgi:hypothetical protein
MIPAEWILFCQADRMDHGSVGAGTRHTVVPYRDRTFCTLQIN